MGKQEEGNKKETDRGQQIGAVLIVTTVPYRTVL